MDADDHADDRAENRAGDPADDRAGSDTELEALLTRARAAYLDRPVTPAPSGLVDSAMSTVALDLRPSRRIALPGHGAVTDIAVANAIRLQLDDDPAVLARRCRVEPDGAGVRVALSVAVSYVHYDRHGDAAVRARVVAAVRHLFGLAVEAVDIDVVDVFTVRPRVSA